MNAKSSRSGRPRVLLVHRRLRPDGGGQAVAAWALEALKGCCDLTLVTTIPVDYQELNRGLGTTLQEGELTVALVAPWKRRLLNGLPTPGEQLRLGLLMVEARRLCARRVFDAVIGTDNEADFGRIGLQYIHYPWHRPPLPDEVRTIHRIPGLVPAYRWLAGPVLGVSLERIRRNRTLANSSFVAGKIREAHDIEARVLHPPVPGGFPDIPWADRETGFVGIGRFHSVKRWTLAVRIVEKVRERGYPATLHIVGFPDEAEEVERLRALAREREWLKLHVGVPRSEMVRVVAGQRYGIHTMEDEHFGIGAAELLRAGCIPFVHNSGGPPEIVGGHPELLFQTEDEAVERIAAALGSESLQQDLLARVESRREMFSETRFMREIRREVGALAGVDLE